MTQRDTASDAGARLESARELLQRTEALLKRVAAGPGSPGTDGDAASGDLADTKDLLRELRSLRGKPPADGHP